MLLANRFYFHFFGMFYFLSHWITMPHWIERENTYASCYSVAFTCADDHLPKCGAYGTYLRNIYSQLHYSAPSYLYKSCSDDWTNSRWLQQEMSSKEYLCKPAPSKELGDVVLGVLHCACLKGDEDTVRSLLAAGIADCNPSLYHFHATPCLLDHIRSTPWR